MKGFKCSLLFDPLLYIFNWESRQNGLPQPAFDLGLSHCGPVAALGNELDQSLTHTVACTSGIYGLPCLQWDLLFSNAGRALMTLASGSLNAAWATRSSNTFSAVIPN